QTERRRKICEAGDFRRKYHDQTFVVRDRRSLTSQARPKNMLSDFKFGLRMLVKAPGFTAIAILTLALGIGANTAIFSIVNAVLLQPLPYPDADRIMVVNESSGPGQDYSVALPDYFDWQNDNTVFEHLAATCKESRNLSGIPGRDPERVSCASVTRNFFN